jgi:hypothetical protein
MATSASSAVRVLVAGAGAFGCEHLDRLATRSDVRIVGVAAPSPAALAHAAQRYGIAQCAETPRRSSARLRPIPLSWRPHLPCMSTLRCLPSPVRCQDL